MRVEVPSCELLPLARLTRSHLVQDIIAICAELAMQLEQQLVGRSIGSMDNEAPAETIRFGTDFGAMALDAGLIILAPALRASSGDGAGAFRFHELDASRVGKGLFRRVDDLDDMAVGAAGRQLGDGPMNVGNRTPEI